jgi:hypothetical protein
MRHPVERSTVADPARAAKVGASTVDRILAAVQCRRFRQVSRQLAGGWVIEVEEPLRSGEVKDAVPALLFGQDDGAFGHMGDGARTDGTREIANSLTSDLSAVPMERRWV